MDIKKLFQVKDLDTGKIQSLLDKIQDTNSVCVHVRLGDITYNINSTDPDSIDYHQKAINLIQQLTDKPHFFVFSDSIELTKKELGLADDLDYASSDNFLPLDDFVLMSKCAHNIIANSTFSWWAAYLNQNSKKIDNCSLP